LKKYFLELASFQGRCLQFNFNGQYLDNLTMQSSPDMRDVGDHLNNDGMSSSSTASNLWCADVFSVTTPYDQSKICVSLLLPQVCFS
jgi:hypothetical protein